MGDKRVSVVNWRFEKFIEIKKLKEMRLGTSSRFRNTWRLKKLREIKKKVD